MLTEAEIKDLLYKSGWSENRKADESALVALIKKGGYEILPKVLDFLVSFDGIEIRFINLRNGILDDITLGFEKGNELEPIDRITEEYELRIGRKLCVIGTAYRRHVILVMAEDGKVYGGYDGWLAKMGDSGIEAIEAIINNKEFSEIEKLPE
jgi:hypothetical protein